MARQPRAFRLDNPEIVTLPADAPEPQPQPVVLTREALPEPALQLGLF